MGTALNVQLGYVTKSGYGIDLRYAVSSPEFEANRNSQLRELDAFTLGLSKYIKDNDLKIQTAITSVTDNSEAEKVDAVRGELILQLIF